MLNHRYWVARNRITGKIEGGSKVVTPHLYLSEKAAMAAKRSNFIHEIKKDGRGYIFRKETDDELRERYDFIPVMLVEINETEPQS